MQFDHLNLSVKDMNESVSWYGRVFGFSPVEEGVRMGRRWTILRKEQMLLAMYEDASRAFVDGDELAKRKIHGINHFGIKVSDRKAWEETLRAEKVPVDMEWRYPHSYSWYITDPTGYEIEVSHWDEDKIQF